MRGPMYSTLDVTGLTGASLRQLQWWDEQGVVRPMQKGQRRLYSSFDVLQVAMIMGLRNKGMSLQKVRQVLGKLGGMSSERLLDMHRVGGNVFLLTDGEVVYVENSAQRVVEKLKQAMFPVIALCISDLIRDLESVSGHRKPAHSAGSSSLSKQVSRKSRLAEAS